MDTFTFKEIYELLDTLQNYASFSSGNKEIEIQLQKLKNKCFEIRFIADISDQEQKFNQIDLSTIFDTINMLRLNISSNPLPSSRSIKNIIRLLERLHITLLRLHKQSIQTPIQQEISRLEERTHLLEDKVFDTPQIQAIEGVKIDFQDYFYDHKLMPLLWIFLMILSIVATIATPFILARDDIFAILVPKELQSDSSIVWLYYSNKVFICALLVYFSVFCSKNFSRAMHNNIIFRQRSASLKAIPAIYNTLIEQEAKNAVIKEAARSIFGHLNTGYIPHKCDETVNTPQPLQQLVNLVRDHNTD